MNEPETFTEILARILPAIDEAKMERLYRTHPFSSDAELLVQLFAAATLNMGTERMASALGISKDAARFIEGHLVASMIVPETAENEG